MKTIDMNSGRSAGRGNFSGLPAHIMTNDEKKTFKSNISFTEDADGNYFMVLPPIPLRPQALGQKGTFCGLCAINEYDSKEKKQKDVIICDGDNILGTESMIVMSLNVAGVALNGNKFTDSDTVAAPRPKRQPAQDDADGEGDEVGGGVAEMSDEEKKAAGVVD